MKPGKLAALLALAVLLAAAGFGAYRTLGGGGARPAWKLAKAESGPLAAVVSATGTLNPVVSVQVGSQVSGQVKETHADFNSEVKAGQLIARIDPENFQHRVRQAEADLDAARAAVAVQQAEVIRSRANLDEAQRDFDRKKLLVEKNFISPAERDKAGSALDASRAQLQVAQAQGNNSAALVRSRETQLAQARVDLERTAIRSPVDGIVVKRSIEPGQTVAASLQAPELFVIARNLTDMQVETAIDEADVGRVSVGQKSTFTVDAFPGRTFEGAVRQVRKAAQVVSNVVTYTVVISAANPDLILLPGMTANVRIVTAEKDRVLKVPNAALRFKPPADEKRNGGKADGRGKGQGKGGEGGRVFVLDGEGKPKAVPVKTGLTDGAMTEIVAGEIAEGAEVVVGATAPSKSAAGAPGPRLF